MISIPVPNLVIVEHIAQTEAAWHTYRLCTILEVGGFYKTSAELKEALPKEFRVCYIPIDAPHSLYAPGHNFYLLSFVSGPDAPHKEDALSNDDKQKMVAILKRFIDSKRYEDCDEIAKALVASGLLAKVLSGFQIEP